MMPLMKPYVPGCKTMYVKTDGETSRDFCFIENVVQINILAASAQAEAKNQVYNVALGERTTLNDLFDALNAGLAECGVTYDKSSSYRDFRAGDVRHSQADISKARELLGYEPAFRICEGIAKAMPWYVQALQKRDNA